MTVEGFVQLAVQRGQLLIQGLRASAPVKRVMMLKEELSVGG